MTKKFQSTQPQAAINSLKTNGKAGVKPSGKQTATGGGNVTPDLQALSGEPSLQCVLSALPSSLQKSDYCTKSLEIAAAAVKPPTVVADNLVSAETAPTKAVSRASKHPRPHESSPQPLLVELPLSGIKADRSVQCRAEINLRTVAQYAERMKAGDKFPPIDVFDDGSNKIVADGQHRFHGALDAGFTTIAARIHLGDRKDAIRFAIQANTSHGLRLSNKDKRHAVKLALNELPSLSDGAIAALCKVSQPFVSKLCRQLKTVMSSASKVGRDGKKRKVTHKKRMAKAEVDAATTTEKADTTGASAQSLENGSAPGSREEFNVTERLARRGDTLWADLSECPSAELQFFIDELQSIFNVMKEAIRDVERTRYSAAIEQSKQPVNGTSKPPEA